MSGLTLDVLTVVMALAWVVMLVWFYGLGLKVFLFGWPQEDEAQPEQKPRARLVRGGRFTD